jgi:Rrf2 family protein
MDVLRRNTDYALRAVVHLARHYEDEPVSSRDIAAAEDISYELTCKLLQKLSKARLVKSTMGPKGGFELARKPEKISIGQVIHSVQGRIHLNRCLMGGYKCPRGSDCPVYAKLNELQSYIDGYFGKVTLAELLKTNSNVKKKKGKK